MICSNCKQENNKESKFCSKCEASLQSGIVNKVPKSNIRNKVFIGIFSSVIVIIAGIYIYSSVNNPLNQFEKAVQEYDLAAAGEIYKSEVKGDKDKEELAKTFLVGEIKRLKQQFKDEEISYKNVMESLDAVEVIEIVNQQVAAARIEINTLNNSRIAFLVSKELLESGNLADALIKLKMVEEVDSNYTEALDHIEVYGKLYKNEILKDAESYAFKGDYEGAITLINDALLVLCEDSDLTNRFNIYEKQLNVQKKEKQEKQKQQQQRIKQEEEEQKRVKQEVEEGRESVKQEEEMREEEEQIALKINELNSAIEIIQAKREGYPTYSQEYRDSLDEENKILQELINISE